jgi:hypothetical protein
MRIRQTFLHFVGFVIFDSFKEIFFILNIRQAVKIFEKYGAQSKIIFFI